MASYISSNANRFYAGLESAYGQTPAITAQNRFPAVKLTAKNQLETADRRDKTGSRTFVGLPTGLRRTTSFNVTTYMTSWGGRARALLTGRCFRPAWALLQRCTGAAQPLAGQTAHHWFSRRHMDWQWVKACHATARSALSRRS